MKKILCLLLAALMLLSLVACGESVDDPTSETKPQGLVTEQETTDQNYVCDLPSNLNYGGETIGILYANVNNKGDEMVSEKLGLGVVSDAVYERNLAVQEMLGVGFEFYPEDDASQVANSQTLDIQGGQGGFPVGIGQDYPIPGGGKLEIGIKGAALSRGQLLPCAIDGQIPPRLQGGFFREGPLGQVFPGIGKIAAGKIHRFLSIMV